MVLINQFIKREWQVTYCYRRRDKDLVISYRSVRTTPQPFRSNATGKMVEDISGIALIRLEVTLYAHNYRDMIKIA